MLLVDTQMKTLRRPAALSDFLHCQDGHLGDIVDALRSDWLLKVRDFTSGWGGMKQGWEAGLPVIWGLGSSQGEGFSPQGGVG